MWRRGGEGGVDWTKISLRLGERYAPGVPVEVLPAATPYVMSRLRELGATPVLRSGGKAKAGPCVTDNGNFILDAAFPGGGIAAASDAAARIRGIVGVVEHGIFSAADRNADAVYYGMEDGEVLIRGGVQ